MEVKKQNLERVNSVQLRNANLQIETDLKNMGILLKKGTLEKWEERGEKDFYGAAIDLERMRRYVLLSDDQKLKKSFSNLNDFFDFEKHYYDNLEVNYFADYLCATEEFSIYEQILGSESQRDVNEWMAGIVSHMRKLSFKEEAKEIEMKYLFDKKEALQSLDKWFSRYYNKTLKEGKEVHRILYETIGKRIQRRYQEFKDKKN